MTVSAFVTAPAVLCCFVATLLCSSTADAAVSPATTPPPAALSADQGAWRRDPFAGSGRAPAAKSAANNAAKISNGKAVVSPIKQLHEAEHEFQLQGIIQSGASYHALINGRTVKNGDSIAGVTIKEISRFKVTVLNTRKETITYDVYQGRINRGKP